MIRAKTLQFERPSNLPWPDVPTTGVKYVHETSLGEVQSESACLSSPMRGCARAIESTRAIIRMVARWPATATTSLHP